MIKAIVTIGYIGLLRPAPGTWGSAVAVVLFYVVYHLAGFGGILALIPIVAVIGYWATLQYLAQTGTDDPSEVVIDEVLGQIIALAPLAALLSAYAVTSRAPIGLVVLGFVLFRAFDILKPWPVSLADRRKDALGVMLDDVLAGVYAGACLTAVILIFFGVL